MKYRYVILIERFGTKVKMKKGSGKVTMESEFTEASVASKDFAGAYKLARKMMINDDELLAIVQKEPILNI